MCTIKNTNTNITFSTVKVLLRFPPLVVVCLNAFGLCSAFKNSKTLVCFMTPTNHCKHLRPKKIQLATKLIALHRPLTHKRLLGLPEHSWLRVARGLASKGGIPACTQHLAAWSHQEGGNCWRVDVVVGWLWLLLLLVVVDYSWLLLVSCS